jgi:hypothetical protein
VTGPEEAQIRGSLHEAARRVNLPGGLRVC